MVTAKVGEDPRVVAVNVPGLADVDPVLSGAVVVAADIVVVVVVVVDVIKDVAIAVAV